MIPSLGDQLGWTGFGPPMKVGVRLEGRGIALAAAFGDDGTEFVQRGDMPVDDRLVHQWPEQFGEEGLRKAAAEIPDRLAAGRLHESGDVQPLVPVVAEGDRALAHRRPDPAPDRLQAEAVLILRPD